MLVSIITITYNSSAHLEQTIRSVLDQNYPEIEYILVDGGSTDGTLDIIRKYEGRISKWVSEPDNGIADAMNKGIRMASGEIIGIIHSDDFYEPEAISAVVRAFRENPDVGVVHGDLRLLNTSGSASVICQPSPEPEKNVWKTIPIMHSTVFIRKRVYEKFGLFDTSFRIAMDQELIARYLGKGVRFLYLERILAGMRLGGVSDGNYKKMYGEKKRIALAYGHNKLKIYLYFFFKTYFIPLEKKAGFFLRRYGGGGIARLYRKIFYPKVPKHF